MTTATQDLRFRLYSDISGIYRRFFDQVVDSEMSAGDAARLAQRVLLARQENLKPLIDLDEMPTYQQAYPDDEV